MCRRIYTRNILYHVRLWCENKEVQMLTLHIPIFWVLTKVSVPDSNVKGLARVCEYLDFSFQGYLWHFSTLICEPESLQLSITCRTAARARNPQEKRDGRVPFFHWYRILHISLNLLHNELPGIRWILSKRMLCNLFNIALIHRVVMIIRHWE